MQEMLIQLDYQIFALLNQTWTSDFLDIVLPPWRNRWTWVPLYALVLAYLWLHMRRAAPRLLLAVVLAVGLSETASSHWVKPAIERARPCHCDSPVSARILIPCGPAWSFTSSHAANHMALAVMLVLALRTRLPRIRWAFIPWALSVGYAQIYVGVHFPFDVLGGFVLGAAVGIVVFRVYALTLSWAEIPP